MTFSILFVFSFLFCGFWSAMINKQNQINMIQQKNRPPSTSSSKVYSPLQKEIKDQTQNKRNDHQYHKLKNCEDFDVYKLNKLQLDPILHWNVDLLHAPNISTNATINDMVELKVLHEHRNGYMSTNGDNLLAWCKPMVPRPAVIHGTTLWVNEQMHLGHSPHDLWVMQALALTKVDLIVLQRAPCGANSNLCQGKGTWVKFFKALYAAMIDAFQPGVPIYVRFNPEDDFTPHYLSINCSEVLDLTNQHKKNEQVVHMDTNTVFERVIRKNIDYLMDHYDNFVSQSTVEKFKQSAYKLINIKHNISHTDINTGGYNTTTRITSGSIVVTFAYRSTSSVGGRIMSNVHETIAKFSKLFPSPQYLFRPYLTPDIHSDASFADDIRVMYETNVLISEHGAYQANMIYMRRGSLFIDLAGIYWNANTRDYTYRQFSQIMQKIVRNFGVFYRRVYLNGLTDHGLKAYEISESEINTTANIVYEYVSSVQ